jgi:diacylglycerol kinase (ATP)
LTAETGSSAAEGTAAGRGPERRIRVIVNASAGQKGGLSTNAAGEDRVRELLQRHAPDAELCVSDSADEARELTHSAVREGYDVVAAAGGAGTIGGVATELLDTPVILGVLPLGSVMNVPRMLGVPRDLEQAAQILANGVERQIDVGEANGRPFYETASVGMNAAMFREAQHFDEGDYRSPLRVLWVAFRYRPARMRIDIDGERVHTRALMVTISNGPYTGVGMTVAPDARLDDGRFDVRIFRHFSKFELLRHLGSIAFGRRGYSPHVTTYRGAAVRVESHSPLPCRADSEDLGSTPLECRVRRAALRVLVAPESPISTGAPD